VVVYRIIVNVSIQVFVQVSFKMITDEIFRPLLVLDLVVCLEAPIPHKIIQVFRVEESQLL
jgi:hypothetical protein